MKIQNIIKSYLIQIINTTIYVTGRTELKVWIVWIDILVFFVYFILYCSFWFDYIIRSVPWEEKSITL